MNEDSLRASFYYGVGVMGLLSGVGLGSKYPNKLALLVGIGSLVYAHNLAPVVDIGASRALQESYLEARQRVPQFPSNPFQSSAPIAPAQPRVSAQFLF